MRAAAVHPSDFGLIQGSYGHLRKLPAVGGREGVAEVTEVGQGVGHLRVGDRVRMPEHLGVWRESLTTQASDLLKLPKNLPDEVLARLAVNPPSALLLLEEFVPLKPGDWVAQNAGNSAVGRAVISLCRSLGVRTLSFVRRPEAASDLLAAGADAVVVVRPGETPDLGPHAGRAVLGLNSVGGENLLHVTAACAPGATVVTFGGMTGDKIRFPTRRLIFDDLVFRGFWLDAWKRRHDACARGALEQRVLDHCADGTFHFPPAQKFPLSEWAAALSAARSPRSGPVLFVNPAA